MTTEEIIKFHIQKYPQMELQDIFKLLFQNEFGGGHLIEENSFQEYLAKEMHEIGNNPLQDIEPLEKIGNKILRIQLGPIKEKISIETLTKLCVLSAKKQKGSNEGLLEKLQILGQMAEQQTIPFCNEQVQQEIEGYIKKGFPTLHHSNQYKEFYHPHYRLLSEEIGIYLPVFITIEKEMQNKKNVIVGIDGMAAAGKTSLAKLLKQVYNCEILHADDFFLQPEQRTQKRITEVGGNIDYERMAEVVENVRQGKLAYYKPYNCGTQMLEQERQIVPQKLVLVEGSYALHNTMIDKYDSKVYLFCDAETQRSRILYRNGPEMLERFVDEWIPMENNYANTDKIKEKSDILINTSTI